MTTVSCPWPELFIGGNWLSADGRSTTPILNQVSGRCIGALPHVDAADLEQRKSVGEAALELGLAADVFDWFAQEATRVYGSALAPHIAESGRGPIARFKGKSIPRELGVAVPDDGLARNADEAVVLANRVGYPVVLKAQAVVLTHKSDLGGVALGVAGEDAPRAACDRTTLDVGRGIFPRSTKTARCLSARTRRCHAGCRVRSGVVKRQG